MWFQDISTLIALTMVINIVMPFVEAAFDPDVLVRYVKRVFDQGKCIPKYKFESLTETKATTIKYFEEVYCGQDLEIFDRLAYIITVVYLAFLYGPGMPYVYIIATFCLAFNYALERYRMAY